MILILIFWGSLNNLIFSGGGGTQTKRREGDGAWKKREAVFSPILEDRVHAMTLPNLRTPNQNKTKKSDNDCMTAEILQKR